MKAMILAAGLSTRLRPYSLVRPKPLFPILNRPLLLLTITRLQKAGFQTIIVNCHHLGEQIQQTLQGEDGIIVQAEEKVLGTGGGLRRALTHFDDEPVLVTNGDIYHTVDYGAVYRRHCLAGDAVTMVLHNFPRFNTVAVDAESRVTGFGTAPAEKTGCLAAFTGIHVINPQVLRLIPENENSSIIDCYKDWLRQGNTVRARIMDHCFWSDIGTPADYLQLHGDLLSGRAPAYEELGFNPTEGPCLVAPDSAIGRNVELHDWVCIGTGARVGDNCLLERVVVWDGAEVAAHSRLRDTIVTPRPGHDTHLQP
jgi:mannose-1-phosphate guanylyltransferase